jgi:hypothetical protein
MVSNDSLRFIFCNKRRADWIGAHENPLLATVLEGLAAGVLCWD